MLVTLLVAPRTAAAAGGRSRPQWDRSPSAPAPVALQTRRNRGPRGGSRAPALATRMSERRERCDALRASHLSPAPGAVEMIGVSGLARNGQTQLDHAV